MTGKKTRAGNRWILIFAGLVIGLLAGVLPRSFNPSAETATEEPKTGFEGSSDQGNEDQSSEYTYAAPLFNLPDDNGDMVDLEAFRGKPVLINFWASWCPPCRQEMVLFEDRYLRYSDDGFIILAINTDDNNDVIREFREENQLSFHLLQDYEKHVVQQYAVSALPTSFFIDVDGNIVNRHVGLITDDVLDIYLSQIGIEP